MGTYEHAESAMLYNRLCEEYKTQHDGELPVAVELSIDDVCGLQDMKLNFLADVKKRGVTDHFNQGRQKFSRENKSVMMVAKLAGEQAKLLKLIRLNRASGAEPGEPEDDDEFERFDT